MKKAYSLLAVVCAVSGCAAQTPRGDVGAAPIVQVAPAAVSLAGRWKIVRIGGRAAVADRYSVTFRPSSFVAKVNCNTTQGDLRIAGDRVTPWMAVTTEIGCNPNDSIDAIVVRTLSRPYRLAIAGQAMTITGDSVLELVRAE